MPHSYTGSTVLVPVDSRATFRQRQRSLDQELRLLKTESIIDALPEGFNTDETYEPRGDYPDPEYHDMLPEGFNATNTHSTIDHLYHSQSYHSTDGAELEHQNQSMLAKVLAFFCCQD